MDSTVLGPQSPGATATTPAKEYDEKGHLIVKLSDRAVATIDEIDGLQSMKADAMIGSVFSGLLVCKTYALFGLRSLTINGQNKILPPCKDNLGVEERAQMLTGRELTRLMDVYAEEFMAPPVSGDELKN